MVRRLDEPDKEYAVLWRSIVKLELFEQLVLNKANELVADGRFEDAYDYFAFLERNKPDTPGLSKAVENSLYEEAKACHRKQQYDGALALLRELHDRNPRRPGLDKALGRTTDELVEPLREGGKLSTRRGRCCEILRPTIPTTRSSSNGASV